MQEGNLNPNEGKLKALQAAMAHFEYSWQWAYKKRFEEAGLTAILGCGFDPGVTSIFTAYAAKHHFDEIQYLDIVDCNAASSRASHPAIGQIRNTSILSPETCCCKSAMFLTRVALHPRPT